jgi:hypothetical protein
MPTLVPWKIVAELGEPPIAGLPPAPLARNIETVERAVWQRAYSWTRLIGEAALKRDDVWQAARRPIPETPLMGAGFVRVPEELETTFATVDGYLFGFCVFATPAQRARPSFLPPLHLEGARFPVLVLPAEYTPHVPPGGPPDPTDRSGTAQGAAACWARPQAGGPNPMGLSGDGILTAGHVAMTVSAIAGMTPGRVYSVAGFAIDAAVMGPALAPAAAVPLAIGPSVVGASVHVYTQGGSFAPATVLLDFQPSGYFGKNCPHRAIIDRGFAPGDSGSLARDSSSGDGIGIYLGDVHPAGVPTQGACQLLEQVTTEFGIDLFL